MTPMITVVLPAFNSAETIGRAVDSILCQDYPNTEIIVVDDGSTDATCEVLKQYDSDLTILQQQNSGPSAARNRALESANGRFVAFLDSDDFWLPGFLSKCASVLVEAPDVVAVSTMTKAIHWSGREAIVPAVFQESNSVIEIDDFFEFWASHDHIRTGSVMFDRETAGDLPLFREELRVSEDLEYWAFLATLGKWFFLPEVLFVTDGRHHSREVTWAQKNQKRREMAPTVEQWEKRLAPRLGRQDLNGFQKMRGRIARNIAHMNILNRNDLAARAIVLTHGKDFPAGYVNKAIRFAARCGKVCWGILTKVLRLREAMKDAYLFAQAKRAARIRSVPL